MKKIGYKDKIKDKVVDSLRFSYDSSSNMEYEELKEWLKYNKIRLNKEMFKAILFVSKQITKNYMANRDYSANDIAGLTSQLFHDEYGEHLNEKELKKYVKEFSPILIERIDSDIQYTKNKVEKYNFNISNLGELFDKIVDITNDSEEVNVLIDNFIEANIITKCEK